MSTFHSKQQKSQSLTDPVLILASILVIGILGFFESPARHINDTNDKALGPQSNLSSVSSSFDTSFTLDEQYWEANCNHGWISDSTCDEIVSRAQSCEISTGSIYCSAYDDYMQQFLKQSN
jgi:hypothetical protein